MSTDRTARVLDIFERFNAGGVEAVVDDDLTEDVEAHAFPEWPGDPVYHGPDGFRRLVAEWTENFDGYRWDLSEVRETPDLVVILARHGGHTKGDGIWVEQPVSAIWRFRGERVELMRYFLTWEEAVAQA